MASPTIDVVDAGPHRVSRSAMIKAPAQTLYALVANPHRHHEFDGSGAVRPNAKGPEELREGDTFTVRMTMFGVPYMITSTVTRAEPGKVLEWRHPGRHHWRYEFEALGPDETRVTETFDYSSVPFPKAYDWMGMPARNAAGIEQTLRNLARTHG